MRGVAVRFRTAPTLLETNYLEVVEDQFFIVVEGLLRGTIVNRGPNIVSKSRNYEYIVFCVYRRSYLLRPPVINAVVRVHVLLIWRFFSPGRSLKEATSVPPTLSCGAGGGAVCLSIFFAICVHLWHGGRELSERGCW